MQSRLHACWNRGAWIANLNPDGPYPGEQASRELAQTVLYCWSPPPAVITRPPVPGTEPGRDSQPAVTML